MNNHLENDVDHRLKDEASKLLMHLPDGSTVVHARCGCGYLHPFISIPESSHQSKLEMKKTMGQYSATIENLSETITSLIEEKLYYAQQVQSKNVIIDDMDHDLVEKTARLERMDTEVKELVERIRQIEADKMESNVERERQRKEIERINVLHREEIETQNNQINDLTSEVDTLRNEMSRRLREGEVQKLHVSETERYFQDQIGELNQTIQLLREKNLKATTTEEEIQNELDKCHVTESLLKKQLNEIVEREKDSRSNSEKLKDIVDGLRKESRDQEKQIIELTNKLKQVELQFDEANKKCEETSQLKKVIEQLTTEKIEIQDRLEEECLLNTSLRDQLERLRTQGEEATIFTTKLQTVIDNLDESFKNQATHIAGLKENLSNSQLEVDKLEAELQQKQTRIEDLQQDIERSTDEILDFQRLLNETREFNSELTKKLQNSVAQRLSADERCEQLLEVQAKIQQQSKEQTQQIEYLEDKLSRMNWEHESLMVEQKKLMKSNKELEDNNRKYEDAIGDRSDDNEKLRCKMRELELIRNENSDTIGKLLIEVKTLKECNDQFEITISEKSKCINDLNHLVDSLKQEIKSLTQARDEALMNWTKSSMDLEKQQSQSQRSSDVVGQLQIELNNTKGELSSLVSENEELLLRVQKKEQEFFQISDASRHKEMELETLRIENANLENSFEAMKLSLEQMRKEYGEIQKKEKMLSELREQIERAKKQLEKDNEDKNLMISELEKEKDELTQLVQHLRKENTELTKNTDNQYEKTERMKELESSLEKAQNEIAYVTREYEVHRSQESEKLVLLKRSLEQQKEENVVSLISLEEQRTLNLKLRAQLELLSQEQEKRVETTHDTELESRIVVINELNQKILELQTQLETSHQILNPDPTAQGEEETIGGHLQEEIRSRDQDILQLRVTESQLSTELDRLKDLLTQANFKIKVLSEALSQSEKKAEDIVAQQNADIEALMDEVNSARSTTSNIDSDDLTSISSIQTSTTINRRTSFSVTSTPAKKRPPLTSVSASVTSTNQSGGGNASVSQKLWRRLREEIIKLKQRNVELAKQIMDITKQKESIIHQQELKLNQATIDIKDLRSKLMTTNHITLENDNLKKDIVELNIKMEELIQNNRKLNSDYQSAVKTVDERKSEVSSVRHEYTLLNEKHSRIQEQYKRQLYHANAEVERLKQECSRLGKLSKGGQSSSTTSKSLKDALEAKTHLEKVVEKQKEELDMVLNSLKDVKQRLKDEIQNVKRLEQKQRELEEQKSVTDSENIHLENSVKMLEDELASALNNSLQND